MVCAVNQQGKQSTFSNQVFVPAYYGLGTITVSPKNERYIMSHHYGDIIRQDIRGFNENPVFCTGDNKHCDKSTVDNNDNIYLFNYTDWPSETNPYGLCKYNRQGQLLLSFGQKGNGIGQFSNPSDVAIDNNQNILILDTGNNRIQAFYSDTLFINEYGNYGDQQGQFNNPRAFCFDTENQRIIVADTDNSRIQIIDFNGSVFSHIKTITNDYFTTPVDVAVNSMNRIIIAERNQVVILDESGSHVMTYTQSNDNYIQPFIDIKGIAVDQEENILVSDAGSNTILTILTGSEPAYANCSPELIYRNTDNFYNGICPDLGNKKTEFTFRVEYNDIDNDPPASGFPKLCLDFNGDCDTLDTLDNKIEGQFNMEPVDIEDQNYVDGKFYEYRTTLPFSNSIQYSMEARDNHGNTALEDRIVINWSQGPYLFKSELETRTESISVLLQAGQTAIKQFMLRNTESNPVRFIISETDSVSCSNMVRVKTNPTKRGVQICSLEWVCAIPDTGVIDPGDSICINVHFTSEKSEWDYSLHGSLLITSIDYAVMAQSITLKLEVANEQTNYALFQRTDATSWEQRTWLPEYVVDGDTSTPGKFWRLRFYPFTALPEDWWEVELEQIYTINKIVIYQGIGGDCDFFNQFHVEASLTGAFSDDAQILFQETDWYSTRKGLKNIYEFPEVSVKYLRLVNDQQKDWAAMQEFQVFYTNLYTSVSSEAENIPSTYQLFQNYPNPFNCETNIRFQLPEKGFCSLKIYNINGQLVSTLIDEEKAPGIHVVHWNGLSEFGHIKASGVYIMELEVKNQYRDVKKLVYIR